MSYSPSFRHRHPALAKCATLTLALAVVGCASVPKPLQGQFAGIAPNAAQDATGQAVRWGGTIAAVESGATETCFQLVGRPLNDETRPMLGRDRTQGRFLACRAGFYEPQVFKIGRSVTVTGHVAGYETRRVGEYDYRQPKVAADVIYLWPKTERRRVMYAYDPFYAPYPWGPWWW
ncbi:MAG: Slp family lipoprotein [Proteobacteria bacterium]|nr:Slp family lipoprotein [Pseudomonadota bacterium]